MDKARALARVTKARQRRDALHAEARRVLAQAIAEAREAGASYPEIGKAAEMSHVAAMKAERAK